MTRAHVLAILRDHREELARAFGVRSLALFGSVARDQATPASDVDVLVEFDRPTGLFGLLRLQERLEKLLGRRVDVGTWGGLRAAVRAAIEAEVIDVG